MIKVPRVKTARELLGNLGGVKRLPKLSAKVKLMAEGGEVEEEMPEPSAGRGSRARNVFESAGMGSSKSMGMALGSLGEMKGEKGRRGGGDTARAQLDDVLRQLKIRERGVQNMAKGLARDTFGAPTLEGPTLTKSALTRRSFAEGGDVSRETMSPEEQPVTEESSASKALKRLMEPVREGARGYFGLEPGDPANPTEAYRTMQALGNMSGAGAPGAIAAGAAGLGSRIIPAAKRLLLMPCSDMKCETPAAAKDLYKGVFYQTYNRQVKPGAEPHMMILSAKHGFVTPKQMLEPYNQKMTPQQAEELVNTVKKSLEAVEWPTGIEEVMLVGGKHYQRVMNAAVDELKAQGKIPEDVVVRATKGEIGQQRQQLGEYLRGIPSGEQGSVDDFIVQKMKDGGEVQEGDARTYLDEIEARDDPIRSGRPLQQRTRRPATLEQNQAMSRAVAQGVANMPYNLLGAPGDIANLLAAPTGRQPFYGSEAVKDFATRMGIRPAPPTDPTQAFLYGAGDIGSALVNPAAPVRAAARGAQAVGEGLSAAAKDFQAYNRALAVPGASYAVKPGGGNWYKLEDRLGELKLSDVPLELYAPNYTGALYEGAVRTNKINQAVNDWVDTKLSKYVRNEIGTVNDPVLKQIDQWELVQKPKLLEEKDRQINKLKADIERVMAERNVGPEVLTRSQARLDKLEKERLFIENQQGGMVFSQAYPGQFDGIKIEAELKRRRAGMPEEPVSKSEAAQQWEALSDASIHAHSAGLLRMFNELAPLPPWFEKLSPGDKVYGLDTQLRTSFNHVVDELRNALDPTVGLPNNLQITPEELKKSSVEKVFKLVDDISAFRRVQQREADMLIAANKATVPVKTYETVPGTTAANDEGLRWVELKIPPPRQDFEIPENLDIVQPRATARDESWAIFDRETGKYTTTGLSSRQDAVDFLQYLDGQKDLQNALKYEGRMLSHCVGGYCPKVETGKSSIFSLRDGKGVPKATVEFTYSMTPGQYYQSNLVSQELVNQITALKNSGQRFNWEDVVRSSPEYQKAAAELNQVKGFDNGTPGAEQLPFVLDFLRSGRVSNITKDGKVDLLKAGIFQVTPGQRLPGFSRTIEPGFYTRDDFKRMAQENDMPQEILDNWMGKLNEVARRGFAHGGPVNKHDDFIARNMQAGGEVSSPEEQPVTEESSASKALKRLIEPVREATKGFFGLDPSDPTNPTEAYKALQAIGNMPGPVMAKGAAKAAMQVPGLLEGVATSIFIGPRAAQWNKAAHKTAVEMEKAGASPQEIWSATMNFRAPDGKWRQEISDVPASMKQGPDQGPLESFVSHPELYRNYPDLQGLEVTKDLSRPTSGYVTADDSLILNQRGTRDVAEALHEVQHAIQNRENFSKGGNSAMAFQNKQAFEILERKRKELSTPHTLEEYSRIAWKTDTPTPESRAAYRDYLEWMKSPDALQQIERKAQESAADEYYMRLHGEAEARAVQSRRPLDMEQRRQMFPLESYTRNGQVIPPQDLIIKRKEGGPVNKHDAFIKAKS